MSELLSKTQSSKALSRRLFLTVGAGLGLGSLSLAQDSRPVPDAAPDAPAAPTQPLVVYAVRHAEKVTERGDPELSPEGTARAAELARVLADVPVDAIYSTNTKRTRTTAQPLATAKGLEIQSYAPGRLAPTLAAGTARCVVVVGHSNTVPALLRGLGAAYEPKLLQGYDDLFLAFHTTGAPLIQHLHYGAKKPEKTPETPASKPVEAPSEKE